jgi:hypothetical protein
MAGVRALAFVNIDDAMRGRMHAVRYEQLVASRAEPMLLIGGQNERRTRRDRNQIIVYLDPCLTLTFEHGQGFHVWVRMRFCSTSRSRSRPDMKANGQGGAG